MSEEENIHENPEDQKTENLEEMPLNDAATDENISSVETIADAEQLTTNDQPQTKNMETHAQELHKAPGRGWKHYFFEFFMLFLAVFCGFLAEN